MITLDDHLAVNLIDGDEMESVESNAVQNLKSLLKRECTGADMLGWLDLTGIKRRELERIIDSAKRIQDENDCLVVVGIGGSFLGAKSAISALPLEARFPVYFAGTNLSAEYHAGLIEKLNGKRFALCVISKSGTTTEPAVAFRILKEKLLENVGEESLPRKITAITDPVKGALRKEAIRKGYEVFEIPPDVGGRFSVLSPVGLLPIAASGVPVEEMLEGAQWAMGRFTSTDLPNEAVRYAAIRYILHRERSGIEVMSTFHPELESFLEWWKQLAGESEGKKGKGLFPASAIMTRDLHSLGQYLQDGGRNILETFLVPGRDRIEMEVPYSDDDMDGLNYLAGKSMGEVNRKALEGTMQAHAAGGLPVIKIEYEETTPYYMGALYVFFEIAIAVSALMLGVNPFDQPGVEEYKRRMFKLLGKPDVDS